MKKIILFLISVFVSVFSATAQNIDDFFAKQKENENVEYVELPSEALKTMNLLTKVASLAKSFSDDTIKKEDAQIISLVSNILDDVKEINFVASKNDKVNLQDEFKKSKITKSKKYRLLGKKIAEKHETIVYGEKGKNKTLKSLLIVLKNKNQKSGLIANVKGNIRLEKVGEMIELASKRSESEKQ